MRCISTVELSVVSAGIKLRERIDAAYAVFAGYPQPSDLESSFRDLTSAPLRELSVDVLGAYAGRALTTLGDATDYKHFLPRILEIASASASWDGFEPSIIVSKMTLAGWASWPPRERAAVEGVFDAAWTWARVQHPDQYDAIGWLCGVALLDLDLREALDGWLVGMTPDAALQLASFLLNADSLPKAIGFWECLDAERRRFIVDWLCSVEVQLAFLSMIDRIAEKDRWLIDSADGAVADLQTERWR